jgi:hypothetical protein
MRRVMAPICIAAVLGGLAAWFFHSPLYRSLDPLQVPRVLLLYVLPERYFTPMDVVLWGTTQSIRGDFGRLAEIEDNPAPALAHRRGQALDVISPGTWTVKWSGSGANLQAVFTGKGAIEREGGKDWSWAQSFKIWLRRTLAGWKVSYVQDLFSRRQSST